MAAVEVGRAIVGTGIADELAVVGRDRITLDEADAADEIRMHIGRLATVQSGIGNGDDLAATAQPQARILQRGRRAHDSGGSVVRFARDRAFGDLAYAVNAR